MEVPVSIFDVLTTRLPIQEAILLSGCNKYLKSQVEKSIPVIIQNDKTTPLMKLTKLWYYNIPESLLNIDDIKSVKAILDSNEHGMFETLLTKNEFLNDTTLQEFATNKHIFKPSNTPEDVDTCLISFFCTCFMTFDSYPLTVTQKYGIFIYATRVFIRYIIWIIQNGHQENTNLQFFNSRLFASSYLSKIEYFIRNTKMLQEPLKQRHVRMYLRSVKKYVSALRCKVLSGKTCDLHVGPKGGIYRLYGNRKYYY